VVGPGFEPGKGRSPRDLQSLLVGHLSILPARGAENRVWFGRSKDFLELNLLEDVFLTSNVSLAFEFELVMAILEE
jgi:hypothetical protein